MSEELNEKEVLEEFVEQNKDSIDLRLKELLVTIILALATLLSAWSGYESDKWNDVEKDFLEDRYELMGEESENTLAAYQYKAAHSNLIIKILEYREDGNTKMYEFFMNRVDSVLKNAIAEWLKLDPENNPDAPRSPLEMSSYKLNFEKKSEELRGTLADLRNSARAANTISSKYLSLTVLMATVLFFAGIAGTLKSKRSQILCLSISVIIFLIAVVVLIGLSIGNS